MARAAAVRSGIAISSDIDYPVTDAAGAIIYGVVRELLSNILRHSQASTANISLRLSGPA